MKVKNIKSFVEFYRNLDITTSMTNHTRANKNADSLDNLVGNKFSSQFSDILYDHSSPLINKKKTQLNQLKSKVALLSCDLKDIATNLVFSDGNIHSEIMLIGEAPGGEEDKQGKPFVGQAGKLLDKMMSLINLKREKNFYATNILYWRPSGNRTPNAREVSICLNSAKEHISIIKPKLLILVGGVSAKAMLNSQDGITKLRGIPHSYFDKINNVNIYTRAIFHPAYLLRNPIEKKRMWDDLLEIDSLISKKHIKR